MTTPLERHVPQVHASTSAAAHIPAVVAGAVVGLGTSSFGLGLPVLAAAAIAVLALAMGRNRLLLLFALGLLGGSALYIGLGLVLNLIDSPSVGSGSGVAGAH
jgi:hypothetical protein